MSRILPFCSSSMMSSIRNGAPMIRSSEKERKREKNNNNVFSQQIQLKIGTKEIFYLLIRSLFDSGLVSSIPNSSFWQTW